MMRKFIVVSSLVFSLVLVGCSRVDNSLSPEAMIHEAEDQILATPSGKVEAEVNVSFQIDSAEADVPASSLDKQSVQYSVQAQYDFSDRQNPQFLGSLALSGSLDLSAFPNKSGTSETLPPFKNQKLIDLGFGFGNKSVYFMVKDIPIMNLIMAQAQKEVTAKDPDNVEIRDVVKKFVPLLKTIMSNTWVKYTIPDEAKKSFEDMMFTLHSPDSKIGKYFAMFEENAKRAFVVEGDSELWGQKVRKITVSYQFDAEKMADALIGYQSEVSQMFEKMFPVSQKLPTPSREELIDSYNHFSLKAEYWISLQDHHLVRENLIVHFDRLVGENGLVMKDVDVSVNIRFSDVGKSFVFSYPSDADAINLNVFIESMRKSVEAEKNAYIEANK